jgi:hypothetical protein
MSVRGEMSVRARRRGISEMDSTSRETATTTTAATTTTTAEQHGSLVSNADSTTIPISLLVAVASIVSPTSTTTTATFFSLSNAGTASKSNESNANTVAKPNESNESIESDARSNRTSFLPDHATSTIPSKPGIVSTTTSLPLEATLAAATAAATARVQFGSSAASDVVVVVVLHSNTVGIDSSATAILDRESLSTAVLLDDDVALVERVVALLARSRRSRADVDFAFPVTDSAGSGVFSNPTVSKAKRFSGF